MPDGHHVVGKSQNFPENIPLFLQKNAGDPAIKVTIPYPAFVQYFILFSPGLCPKAQDTLTATAQRDTPKRSGGIEC
jgi:hypothetical protein